MTTAISGTSGITFPDASIQSTAATGVVSNNRLINGAMAVSQRNGTASQTITAGAALAYTVDRWYAYSTGANVTGQQVAGTFASSQYRYQFTGAASVTAIGFGQRIEQLNSFDLANTTATLSCYISNSLLTTVTWTASYANTADTFGSLASPTVTQIATGTFTVSSTRTQYTTNISIPSAATTGIQIVFTVGAQTSGTWIVDTIQLAKGSSVTSFDVRPYGTELMLCQRYCPVYYAIQGNYMALGLSSTTAAAPTPLTAQPRVVPTGLTAIGTWYTNTSTTQAVATMTFSAYGGGFYLTATAAGASITANNSVMINGDAASKLILTGCEL